MLPQLRLSARRRVQEGAEALLGQRADGNHIGLPRNNAGWVDLLTETMLLPKPDLMGVQHGLAPQPQQQAAAAAAAGRGAGLAALVQNPWVQQYLANNPDAIGTAISRQQASLPEHERHAAFVALSREEERRWEQIPWMKDAGRPRCWHKRRDNPFWWRWWWGEWPRPPTLPPADWEAA